MEVTFRSEDHSYWMGPAKLDSVTQLISRYTEDSASAFWKDSHVQRGRTVHHLTTMIDDDNFIGAPEEYLGYCDAYREFLEAYKPKWKASEQIVSYQALYAGTLDRWGAMSYGGGMWGGPLDIKTGPYHAKQGLQLAGYFMAYTGHRPTDSDSGLILCLQKTGKYSLRHVMLVEPGIAWSGLIDYHTWRRKTGC